MGLSFNSRVRGGRDARLVYKTRVEIDVSTHASAGDATGIFMFDFAAHLVSTHASAGDATSPSDAISEARRCFNSRVRGGRD